MRKLIALVCFVAVAPVFSQDRTPKGKESGLYQRATVVESDAVASIAPESVAGYESTPDGTRFTVLHIRHSGAEALRLRLENVRLPEGASLLVYGAGQEPAWAFKPGSEEAAVVVGESAFIEVQCGAECPADLPFDISEVTPVSLRDTLGEPQPTAAGATRGITNFRGVDVEYEVSEGLAIVEGDIILGRVEEMQPARGDKDRQKDAVGLSSPYTRWPNGRVPYAIDANVPDQARVINAANHWNAMTGGAVRFVPRTNEAVYVRIVRSNSCSAMIGMSWSNIMRLGDTCTTGNVIHEFGHTLGLDHEHTRSDRGRFVRIIDTNIVATALSNFVQISSDTDDIGSYDYNSIMHYGAYSFSSNGRPTIETIPAGIPIGQRVALSSGDIAAVRKMYGYNGPAPDQTPAPTPVPTPVPAPPPPPPPPVMVPVTISTNPLTERIVVDGATYKGSVTLQWTSGSTHTISAVNRPAANGSSATFVGWSDGGAATHTVTASAAHPLLKADFAINYSVSARSSNDRGSVRISPASSTGFYPANSAVRLTAVPDAGYCFAGWSGLIAGTPADTNLSVTKPYAVTALFEQGTFTLSHHVLYADNRAATYNVNVTGTPGCSWTATSQAPWVRVHSNTHTGSGSQPLVLEANTTGSFRVGTVTIAGRTMYVVQYP